ncbi:hypothetical protein [Amycolatopsis taiwanensis]|uniref:hypothetical protein n=1 Tax=Amycolatopsis taiwanensis TaxID=342230 RepID=UPI0004B11BBB|nr:hypothetical protein [Amycolatopsis taiwanensis]
MSSYRWLAGRVVQYCWLDGGRASVQRLGMGYGRRPTHWRLEVGFYVRAVRQVWLTADDLIAVVLVIPGSYMT